MGEKIKLNSISFAVVLSAAAIIIFGSISIWDDINSSAESSFQMSSVASTPEFSLSALTKGEVVRVKDGDTYVLIIGGEETTVRLIGVDTPESVAPDEYSKENTSEGRTISEIVKQKIQAGDTLYVEYDVLSTDKYGRTLAYLYFEDSTMVQEWLLENGYAQVMTVQPNCKYAEEFAALQHTAAENKVGLWAGIFESE